MSGYLQSSKYISLVVTVKLTGLLSLIGSGLIIHDLLRSRSKQGERCYRQKNMKITYKRILLLMSISDMIYGFVAWIMGSWMVPKETGAFWAAGNDASCQAQGFLQLWFYGTATCLNASLSLTYILTVQFGWREQRLQQWLPQFFLLAFPLLFFCGLSTWGLVEDAYTFNYGPTCGVPRANKIYAVLGMVWQFACFSVIFISALVLWYKILAIEKRNDMYRFGGGTERTQSNRVAKEGLFYAGSFFLTYFPFLVIYIMSLCGRRPEFWMIYVTFFCLPLQGFWNACVYFRKKDNGLSMSNAAVNIRSSTGRVIKRVRLSMGGSSLARLSMAGTLSTFISGASHDRTVDSSLGFSQEIKQGKGQHPDDADQQGVDSPGSYSVMACFRQQEEEKQEEAPEDAELSELQEYPRRLDLQGEEDKEEEDSEDAELREYQRQLDLEGEEDKQEEDPEDAELREYQRQLDLEGEEDKQEEDPEDAELPDLQEYQRQLDFEGEEDKQEEDPEDAELPELQEYQRQLDFEGEEDKQEEDPEDTELLELQECQGRFDSEGEEDEHEEDPDVPGKSSTVIFSEGSIGSHQP